MMLPSSWPCSYPIILPWWVGPGEGHRMLWGWVMGQGWDDRLCSLRKALGRQPAACDLMGKFSLGEPAGSQLWWQVHTCPLATVTVLRLSDPH